MVFPVTLPGDSQEEHSVASTRRWVSSGRQVRRGQFNLQSEKGQPRFPQPSIPAPNSSFLYPHCVGSLVRTPRLLPFSDSPSIWVISKTNTPIKLHNWFPVDGRCHLSACGQHITKNFFKKIIQGVSQALPKAWFTWWALGVSLSCWQLLFLNKLVPAEMDWILSDLPELMSLKTPQASPHIICELPPCR